MHEHGVGCHVGVDEILEVILLKLFKKIVEKFQGGKTMKEFPGETVYLHHLAGIYSSNSHTLTLVEYMSIQMDPDGAENLPQGAK